MNLFERFAKDDSGVLAIEYVLLTGIVVMTVSVLAKAVADNILPHIKQLYETLGTWLVKINTAAEGASSSFDTL